MTEEQIAAKKKYAGEKRASMKRRDDHNDYTERRMYMITIETEGRQPLFGTLAGDPFAAPGSADEPRIVLSQLGQAVQSQWLGIPAYYPQIEVMAIQMMPDHLHGILFVKAPLPVHLGQVITGFKTGCRKAQRALQQTAAPAAAQPHPTGNATAAAPSSSLPAPSSSPSLAPSSPSPAAAASLPQPSSSPSLAPSSQATAVPLQSPASRPLFAKGYNDLILRTYDELGVWKNYLRDNPRRLMMKRARPEWLRPFFDLRLGTHTYSGIGNRALLSQPRRLVVLVSRRLNESELQTTLGYYLDQARQGAVLVSPAISPGEKLVMRTAFDAGLPTIVLMENGFTPLTKPHGEQFYACAEGRLLMLSPWPHHNDRRRITSVQCHQLNAMALELCQ